MSRPDFEEVFGLNAAYAEKVYSDYLEAPEAVPEEWRRWFNTTLPEDQRAVARAAVAVAPPVAAAANASTSDVPAGLQALTGVAARIVANMEDSLSVPTATSSREVPVKVLEENRHILNRHQQGLILPKVSFTHLIAFAALQAIARVKAMAGAFVLVDGKPFRKRTEHVNFGVAIDLPGKDGRRSLVVPNVKNAGAMDFKAFLTAYSALIDRARAGKLTPEDFADTTWTLTNPGTIGTQSSLPRLMSGQAFILATGAITVPGALQGASVEVLTELGVSNVMTLTSTYDHRVIQGAESGQFLDWMYRLLLGEEGFYEGIFRSLKVPYRPVHMVHDRRPPLGSTLRESENLERAAGLMTYIRSYRVRGHVLADLDPLSYAPKDWPELDMSTYGLTIWDKERTFYSDGVTKKPFATLREIQETLHLTYCRHIGVEYMHIADMEQRRWLRHRMEGNRNAEELPKAVMLRALDKLVSAEAFERFLHTRFVGHKRFSLEGGETLIPVLDALLEHGADSGIRRVVLGMAHRGRLNVLAHVLQKPLTKIFTEFEGYLDPDMTQGSGDVKYHLGATAVHRAQNGADLELELACNPSHLEAVDPVVEGVARARMEQLPKDQDRRQVLPVLVHGDAAFAGQGIVHETLQMSQLHGYRTGGTVHVVVNNQIGYTTSPEDSRSTPFCTDVAKGVQAPVFHVNGDDPLAAIRMIRLALDYRMQFQRDVVLDIVCYRRHGHNEGDEPRYTQPLLYKAIEQHPTVREQYQDFLVRAGVLQKDDIKNYDERVQHELKGSLDTVRLAVPPEVRLQPPSEPREWLCSVPLVPQDRLAALMAELLTWPEDFHGHPKVKQVLARRSEMMAGHQPVDFATAETLAFATLVTTGTPIRLAGQDSGRGTFSQRHASLFDFTSNRRYVPLDHLEGAEAPFVVVDSLLSEEAALGFEYGYSVARPESLCLWEAQFGDFCNGAQIQIDQFLAAGEAKWSQQSGLVLLLPHGYDGQGPEHSSARLERFLQLCAEQNMRVANPSTAGSYYHLLRRQAVDADRKPLIVMTPKSLLRQKEAGSPVAELSQVGFQPVKDDAAFAASGRDPKRVKRVVACSGKVYYDLVDARGDRDDVAIVRLELLYPFPETPLAELRSKYGAASWVFCQEEPQNMGAWTFVRDRFDWASWATRPAAASPATGSLQRHKQEQADLVVRALG
jgi:2-oxoglutarate dehydrogenase E1 component